MSAKARKTTAAPAAPSRSRRGQEEKKLDEEGVATAAMIDEIRNIMSSGPQAPPRKGSKSTTDAKTANNPLGHVPSFVKGMQERGKKREQIRLKNRKVIPNKDDLLSHYLNQAKPEVQFTSEQMTEKEINAPYMDTIVMVEQRMWMEEYLQKHRDTATGNTPQSQISTTISKAEASRRRTQAALEAVKAGNSVDGEIESKSSAADVFTSSSVALPPPNLPIANAQSQNQPLVVPPTVVPPRPGSTVTTASPISSKKIGLSVSASISALQASIRKKEDQATIDKYRRRYPRLCNTMNLQLTPDLPPFSQLEPRSDNWMVRFMEECYDEAMAFIAKPISDTRRRKRCGLDLGALDAFPLVVERWITRTYSTLELRQRMTIEILLTLDNIAKMGELAAMAGTFGKDADKAGGSSKIKRLEENIKADIAIDGGRAQTFAKFLAEELDLDYLAMFLLTRERVQTNLGFHFRDVNPVALNEVTHRFPDPPPGAHTANAFMTRQEDVQYGKFAGNKGFGSDVHGTTFSGIAEGAKTKVIPVVLPKHMEYIVDVSMPNTPLVTINTERIEWLVEKLTTQGLLVPQRDYFVNRVLKNTDKLLDASNKRLEMLLPLHAALPEECDVNGRGILINGNRCIHIYCILHAILEQWKEVPPEAKGSFSVSGTTANNLKELNIIYDNDNALMKSYAKKIKDAVQELSDCKSKLMKLEKQRRRLERKWNVGLNTEEELDTLRDVRVMIVEYSADLEGIDSRIVGLEARQKLMRENIENLWFLASSSVEIEAVNSAPGDDYASSKLAPSRWKEEVTHNLVSAIAFNEESVAAVEANKKKFEEMGETLVKTALEHAEEIRLEAQRKPKEPTLRDIMASIEQEALELSKLGQSEALGLGLLPVPAPYISHYEMDKKEAERLRLLKEQELIQEEVCREAMGAEEQHVRKARQYELFVIEHKRRVAQLEKEREEKQRKALIHSTAMQEMTSMVRVAAQSAAEVALVKRLEELALLQEKLNENFKKEVQEITSEQVEEVVCSAVALGVQRVAQKLVEEARLIEIKRQRVEAMKRRIEETSRAALSSVHVSLAAAVTRVVDAAVAELNRQHQMRLAEERAATRVLVLETVSKAVGMDTVDFATQKAQEYFEAKEKARIQLEEQLEEEAVETLALQALAVTEYDLTELELQNVTEECIELAIEDTEKEERRQRLAAIEKAKALKNLKYKIGRISRALVKMAVQTGTSNAESYHTDPERLLDLDPHTWLEDEVLGEVEEMFLIATMIRERLWKKALFRGLSHSRAVREQHCKWLEKIAFKKLVVLHTLRKSQHAASRVIGRYIRKVAQAKTNEKFAIALQTKLSSADAMALQRRQNRTVGKITWWKYWAHAEARARVVRLNILEREYMKAWMTWKYKYKLAMEQHAREEDRRARAMFRIAIMIKLKISRRRKWRLRCNLRIVWAAKYFLARRALQLQKRKMLILHEYEQHIAYRNRLYTMKFHRMAWQFSYNRCQFFHKLHMVTMHRLVKRKFIGWKFGAKNRTAVCNKAARKIQAAVRMWIIKRYVLNYFRWRRGLVGFQANFRRRSVKDWFQRNLQLYRSARCIQTNFRGWFLRSHFTDRRIMDMHYAAAANNYDKLRYYTTKYPELVNELDRFGNTALHNAAKNAARRTLKLLLKMGVDPNALNLAGYSALHLIIISKAINRDDCCLYMLERGFDEDQLTPDGKTCLLLAVEHGRYKLCETLIQNNPKIANQPDNHGTTPLQASFAAHVFSVTRLLVEYGADVNAPGYCGTFPLHDCIQTGDIDYPNLLLSHGAHINVREPFHEQTPLMWACTAGLPEFASLYVMQGADIMAQDDNGWTAAHHAAHNGNWELYDPLRFGDMDFDYPDFHGKSSLHIAAEFGRTEFAKHLLLGCCNVHMQDSDGNQPSHIAARDNKLETLKMICIYDEHIGRINYAHQTPLGIAKMHQSREAQAFLELHYKHIEGEIGRNAVGDLWWDQEVEESFAVWAMNVDEMGNRWWVNQSNGQVSYKPPAYDANKVIKAADRAEVSMARAVVKVGVEHENTLTRHGYMAEYAGIESEVQAIVRINDAATCIQKYARRKCAYMEKKFLSLMKAKRKLQATRKGYLFRRDWKKPAPEKEEYPHGLYNQCLRRLKKRTLGRQILRLWKRFKYIRNVARLEIAARLPKNEQEWENLVKRARYVHRTVGVYEEYVYPGYPFKIFFYRQRITKECSLTKPAKLEYADQTEFREKEEKRKIGCTWEQWKKIIKVQALYRGYKIRSYYTHVEKAMIVNYERARKLYQEGLRRMEWRGPDVAFLLYSYAIFAYVTHDLDYSDICALLSRARIAEEVREQQMRNARGEEPSQAILNGTYRHGKIYDLANIGFFRKYANDSFNERGWHNYAACRFLIYNDFPTSFDSFLEAFRYAPKDKRLKENFDTMMRHFHGYDKRKLEAIVRERMQMLAQKEAEVENEKTFIRETAHLRKKAANRIKGWYRDCKNRKGFHKFMTLIRELRAKKLSGES
eukprot:GSChrysophyteH1.ASY1.ANO1.2486.1 assembled CDS